MSELVSILFTIPNFITAGSGRAMLNIVERLDRGRFAPAVCVLRKGGKLDGVVENMEIPFLEASFTVPGKPYATLPERAWGAAHLFRKYKFQIWHSFHYASDYTEPLIARLSGAQDWVYTKKNMNWYRRAWYIRSLLASGIAAQNSDMMKDFFCGMWYRRKTRLVRRGVPIEHFKPDVLPYLNIRSQNGITRNATVVACVAHLLPVKGHPTLLQAVAQIPDLHLVLAGNPLDAKHASELRRQVQDFGIVARVHFLGGVEDVPALLAEVDIAVLPTWARWRMEGCPVALLEAMSCAKACIATDIPGSRDLVVHGQSGLLVPPEDPESLTLALRQLVGDPDLRRRLGQNARDRVKMHFTIEREVADHEDLYEEILTRRRVLRPT